MNGKVSLNKEGDCFGGISLSEVQELRQKLGLIGAQVEQAVSIISGEIEKRKAVIEEAARSGGASLEQIQRSFSELRQETEKLLSGCLSREQLSEWKKNVQDGAPRLDSRGTFQCPSGRLTARLKKLP